MTRLLEPEERQRFVRYCREQAVECEATWKKLETVPEVEASARHNRNLSLAYSIVANELDFDTTDQSGGK